MTYFYRFFVPYPLSAFHPYPSPSNLGWAVLLSPLFIVGAAIILWLLRRNKDVIFGSLFFIVNLLLVLQIVSIGNTIVSERYTYVPYIGLALLLGLLITKYSNSKSTIWIVSSFATLVFGIITFQRTKVWKDSHTLWSNVIEHYPSSPMARTNRANYTINETLKPEMQAQKDMLFQEALEDCNIALKSNPNHVPAYENRQYIYYNLNKNKEALADAQRLIKLDPRNRLGYYTRGLIYMRLNEPTKALSDFDTCISIKPDYDAALNNRGTVLVNSFQKYAQALNDFNKAISINPNGDYYLNRSVCYFRLGDIDKSKADAQTARQKGVVIPGNLRQLLGL
jgi:tetratricopeptide (TPR) repeat protein